VSELQLLFLILAALYGWECACWIRRGSVAFRTWLGRRWCPAQPGTLLGNQRGGFVFAPPLPPLGTLLTAVQFPLSLSAEALLAHVASSVNPGSPPTQTGKCLRWEDIREVEAHGKQLRINGEVFARTATATFTTRLAEELRQLAQLSVAKRSAGIENLVHATLDAKAAKRRWREFRQQTTRLRWLTNWLFGYLFVAAPLACWYWGLSRCWIALLGGLLGFTTTTAILFRRAHRTWYPDAGEERLTHFLTILLAPATTIRALDVLARPLLEWFHPMAVAQAMCPETEFRRFAERIWRELRHPGLPLCPIDTPLARTTESTWRGMVQTAVASLLQRSGIDPDELIPPPAALDETCRSYCPRCRSQFTTGEGVCADCGGVALLALGHGDLMAEAPKLGSPTKPNHQAARVKSPQTPPTA